MSKYIIKTMNLGGKTKRLIIWNGGMKAYFKLGHISSIVKRSRICNKQIVLTPSVPNY